MHNCFVVALYSQLSLELTGEKMYITTLPIQLNIPQAAVVTVETAYIAT